MSAEDKFFLFSQKIGFEISCNMSKCQSLFSGKSKKNIISLPSADFAQRVVKRGTDTPPREIYDNTVQKGASLQKHTYSNTMKISPPKTENFHIKNFYIFFISAQKHRLWVFVRTASPNRLNQN